MADNNNSCTLDVETRWVSTSAYTYIGDYKYEILQEEYRLPGGNWITTNNTKLGDNPTKVGKKIRITMQNGDVFSQSCGDDNGVWHSYHEANWSALSETAIQHMTNNTYDGVPVIGGDLNYVEKIEFGDCLTELGWRYRNEPAEIPCTSPKCLQPGGGKGCGPSYWDNDVSTSGEQLKYISMPSFVKCGVKEIVFPNTLRWIGDGEFAGNNLRTLTIPSSVESLGLLRSFDQGNPRSSCMDSLHGVGAFASNKYLKNITLNEGLKIIGQTTFNSCTSLERIDIPASLERIGRYVFDGCTNLKQIVFKGSTPPSLICDDDSIYYSERCLDPNNYGLSANSATMIYVPCGSKTAYTQAIQDFPAEKIIEYGGECGDIPSIASMYLPLFSYKIGTATTTVYSVYESSQYTQAVLDDQYAFSNVIDGYADEITIPSTTYVDTVSVTVDCEKFIMNGDGWMISNATEVIVNTTGNAYVGAGGRTRKIVFNSGYTNNIGYSYGSLPNLEEVYIHDNISLNETFKNCHKLRDVYITYSGSVIVVNDDAPDYAGDVSFENSYPTIHVPCNLFANYKSDSFWSKFNIVVDDCGYISYTTTGTPYCTGYNKYVDVYHVISCDSGSTWATAYTTPMLVERNSTDCGYPIYRWTQSGTTCIGNDKYQNNIKERSTDGGATWTVVTPAEYSASTLIEVDSSDCLKFVATYSDNTRYSATCDSSSSLTTATTRAHYSSYTTMTTAVVGSCNTSIGVNAFRDCSGLTSVAIPSSVTGIGSGAFYGCSSLTSITIPGSVTNIDAHAFRYCSGLTSVTIPDSVTSIDITSFGSCKGLTSVTIGSGVTNIYYRAFSNCGGLTSFTIYATTPPTLGNEVFLGSGSFPIYVPAASVDTYKSTTGWSTYSSRIFAIP